ncbi:MAG: CopG family transcriptional regulator [Dehalococcoidia bacterium]
MRYQRTQVYLDPEDHRRLRKEARERGVSLTALLRQIVSAHVSERAPAYEPKSFDAITGIVDLGEPTNIVDNWDAEMAKAMHARYEKKMGKASKDRRRAAGR